MPTTGTPFPILSHFLCAVEKHTGMPAQPLDAPMTQTGAGAHPDAAEAPKRFPKGVVLGKDGKPCRSCTSFASWAAMSKKQTSASNPNPSSSSTTVAVATTSNGILNTPQPPPDCPPDVEALGRASWTLLHSITATYPETPSASMQASARQFVSSFATLYPCWYCGSDFQAWMAGPGNTPRVSSRREFGEWMCEAHNAVNEKLGKEKFDCTKWEERWRTGWKDGRCD